MPRARYGVLAEAGGCVWVQAKGGCRGLLQVDGSITNSAVTDYGGTLGGNGTTGNVMVAPNGAAFPEWLKLQGSAGCGTYGLGIGCCGCGVTVQDRADARTAERRIPDPVEKAHRRLPNQKCPAMSR